MSDPPNKEKKLKREGKKEKKHKRDRKERRAHSHAPDALDGSNSKSGNEDALRQSRRKKDKKSHHRKVSLCVRVIISVKAVLSDAIFRSLHVDRSFPSASSYASFFFSLRPAYFSFFFFFFF
jgi:hypothetical protein